MSGRLEGAALTLGSIAIGALPFQPWIAPPLSGLEAAALISLAWSVWLLARNRPLGWFVGLAGVALYGVLFWQVQLYGEVGLQAFYFVTSLQAIAIWLRGGPARQERPVGRLRARWHLFVAALGLLAWAGLRSLLLERAGAAPTWDALTTVLSVIAHLYLMGRYVESWYLWITVDLIYVPLYASRGLNFTAGLYAFFLILALRGLLTFRALADEAESGEPPAAGAAA